MSLSPPLDTFCPFRSPLISLHHFQPPWLVHKLEGNLLRPSTPFDLWSCFYWNQKSRATTIACSKLPTCLAGKRFLRRSSFSVFVGSALWEGLDFSGLGTTWFSSSMTLVTSLVWSSMAASSFVPFWKLRSNLYNYNDF